MLRVLRHIPAHPAVLRGSGWFPRRRRGKAGGSEAAMGRCAQPRAIICGELGCADNLLALHISLLIINLS